MKMVGKIKKCRKLEVAKKLGHIKTLIVFKKYPLPYVYVYINVCLLLWALQPLTVLTMRS